MQKIYDNDVNEIYVLNNDDAPEDDKCLYVCRKTTNKSHTYSNKPFQADENELVQADNSILLVDNNEPRYMNLTGVNTPAEISIAKYQAAPSVALPGLANTGVGYDTIDKNMDIGIHNNNSSYFNADEGACSRNV